MQRQECDCFLAARLLDGRRPKVSMRDGLKACSLDIETRLIKEFKGVSPPLYQSLGQYEES